MGGVADLTPQTVFAGCRIEEVVGRGGMGVVYRATQLRLMRPVALKLLAADRAADPEFRTRFEREWRMAAAIDHPHVIPVYEAGEEDGRLYLVLRIVEGSDLHQLLRREGPLRPARAVAIVGQVASALDAAHAAGLVHRDVKPANVLLSGGDHAYLTDFGLTRLTGSATDLTEVGRWMGTVGYAAPEQLRAERTDARSDVYSLGCVLFAALTGQPPFPHETVPAAFLAHLNEPPPRPSASGVPAAFDGVIARALAKAPEERYPSAGDLCRAAFAAARGEPITDAERSVARGAAAPEAPTSVMTAFTAVTPAAPAEERTDPRTAVAAVAAPPDPAGPARPRPRGRALRLAVGGLVVAGLCGLGVGMALNAFGGTPRPPQVGPVTEAEVRDVVTRFARAYEAEDPQALGRTLTRGVERVLPAARQQGRDAVVAQYRGQFAAIRVETYEIEDLDARGGDVGRATGRYVVTRRGEEPFGGGTVFGVVRESGRPRIDLVLVRPES
jgi:hypothetical protein